MPSTLLDRTPHGAINDPQGNLPCRLAAPGGRSVRDEPLRVFGLSTFGEDARGELYLASVQSGNVYKLVGS